jgi:transposase
MPTHYSSKFKEKMVQKMAGPNGWSANALAAESGVPQSTLSRWLREATVGPMTEKKKLGSGSKRKRWTPEEKVRVVMESAAAGESGLGALLRREGLHQADLERLRTEVLAAATKGLEAEKRPAGLSPEQKRVKKLEKELRRKDKALAEAAALLVLRKKAEALFLSEEEGDTRAWKADAEVFLNPTKETRLERTGNATAA